MTRMRSKATDAVLAVLRQGYQEFAGDPATQHLFHETTRGVERGAIEPAGSAMLIRADAVTTETLVGELVKRGDAERADEAARTAARLREIAERLDLAAAGKLVAVHRQALLEQCLRAAGVKLAQPNRSGVVVSPNGLALSMRLVAADGGAEEAEMAVHAAWFRLAVAVLHAAGVPVAVRKDGAQATLGAPPVDGRAAIPGPANVNGGARRSLGAALSDGSSGFRAGPFTADR